MRTWVLLLVAALTNAACIHPDITLGRSDAPCNPTASRIVAVGPTTLEASPRAEPEPTPATELARAERNAELVAANRHAAPETSGP